MTKRRRTRRTYGAVRQLRSGRYQASHLGPDGRRYRAPVTFETKDDADGWLAAQRTDISRGEWERPAPPKRPPESFATYAASWLATRQLTPRTRTEYRKILDSHILPTFGSLDLDEITPPMVRQWYAELGQRTGPTRRAHAYALLRTILGTAVTDDLVPANPCRIRGAGSTKRARTIRPATLAELEGITRAMPERYQAAILLAAWCALRFGELAELRRKDIDLERGVVRVRRAVTYIGEGTDVVGAPKSDAGTRDVAIPPHLLPAIRAHLMTYTQPGRDGLLFPSSGGKHLRSGSALHDAFHVARTGVGRPDLTVHDLRHTGATLASATGATIAELMARLGHSTPQMAMRYQHAAADRDRAIAEALTALHEADVVDLKAARRSS